MSLRTLTKVAVIGLLSLTTLAIVSCSSKRGRAGGGAIRHVVLISIDTRQAVNTAQAALELATAANARPLAKQIGLRLARYRRGQSFVERIRD